MSSATVTTSDGGTAISRDDDDDNVSVGPPAPPAGHRGHDGHGEFTVGLHSDKPLDGASFVAGLMLGMLLYFIVQTALRWHARREARGHARTAAIGPRGTAAIGPRGDEAGRMAADVAALARRTATLEMIVTDPAHRTARDIEALR